MMYFHKSSCISPQHTFGETDFLTIYKSENNWLTMREPNYLDIPNGLLRRMGKAVRVGVGAAMPLLKAPNAVNGIIIGTANGGMEDCVKFLNQIITYNEGTLTPTNFVQSTTNAIAGQIGLLTKNTGYNATHVHRGLAFENALLDAYFQLREHTDQTLLVGGLDEISEYNYNIDFQAGWYKKEPTANTELLASNTPGSLAGEGAAFFTASAQPGGAVAKLESVKTMHCSEPETVKYWLQKMAKRYAVDLVFLGENGDVRLADFYKNARDIFAATPALPYKHLCGEYPTSSAFALWLAIQTLEQRCTLPFMGSSMLKSAAKTILIYNTYHQEQHSVMVVSAV